MDKALLFIFAISFVPLQITSQRVQHIANNNGDEISFNYNNTYLYNVPYMVKVNKSIEYIMEFSGLEEDVCPTPARVTVVSDFANRTYPVFITARQQKGVFSWQLPVMVETPSGLQQFNNISRTLCPHNNVFSEDVDTCDLMNSNTPVIHITSSSPVDIEVVIILETVRDFYIKLNSTTNFTIAPGQPTYYFFPFKQEENAAVDFSFQKLRRDYMCNKLDGDESRRVERYIAQDAEDDSSWFSKSKSVIVMIESDNDVCAVISIQNLSCPVFDNERDILYDGYYLTMTTRGGITLTQDIFPVGFYIVFIVKTSDEDCVGRTPDNGTVSGVADMFRWRGSPPADVITGDGRLKSFSFKIISTISYKEYFKAAGAALGFFVSFYVAFIVAIVCQKRRKNLTNNSMEANQSEDGQVTPASSPTPPTPSFDEATTSSLQQRNINVDTSREHLVEGGDVTAGTAHELPTPSFEAATTSSLRQRNVNVDTSRIHLVEAGDVTTGTAHDCSSSSDTDSSYSTLEDHLTDKDVCLNGVRLRVSDLARSRPRVLAARSKMYLYSALTVAVFYTLPVVQLVVTYQRMLNQSGNQDLCYFNFLCAHPLMMLTDFNHVYSNLGYVLLGFLFLIQVWRRNKMDKAKTPAEQALGIPKHFGLLYAMGVALVSEGILSAAYHVCPNSMNFQFDTSFMYVTSVLCMVKIYQSRHPDINARAHATFGVLAIIIFVGLIGVLDASFFFWVAFTGIHLIACFILTYNIYYLGKFRLAGVCGRVCRALRSRRLAAVRPGPARAARAGLLALANLANWAIAGYGMAQHDRDFGSHLLLLLMSNLFLYTLFYIVMKLVCREGILWYSWLFIALTYGTWFSSAYFYLDRSTNWALTPALSRQDNRVCSFLELYDNHDIWHFMSAVAMFFSFNMYLTIDDNLRRVPRSDITPF